jgi:thiosulfate dehydrogenase [quinone] large subunit
VTTPSTRRLGAFVAALIGAYLMYVALDPQSGAGTAVWTFLGGLVLWVAIAAVLLRFYSPGTETFSADEVAVAPEWRFARFLRLGQDAAPLYLGLRLFLGYEWLHAGWGKLTNPAWSQTGQSLRAYWERVAAVPQQGNPPITYPAYRALIQYMVDNEWYAWFNQVIIWGEILVGLGLLLGGLTAIAALGGLLLNFSFLFAGSSSSNPTLIILGALIIYGWRVAGWWGLDRVLLPALGTPWGRGSRGTSGPSETPPAPAQPSPAGT